jgi:hypothetical protein
MAELIQQYSNHLLSEDGSRYVVQSWGERRPDGVWEGWLEFRPSTDALPHLRTGVETTQPKRDDLVYWASGLEPVYFQGAFDRSHPVDSPTEP